MVRCEARQSVENSGEKRQVGADEAERGVQKSHSDYVTQTTCGNYDNQVKQ